MPAPIPPARARGSGLPVRWLRRAIVLVAAALAAPSPASAAPNADHAAIGQELGGVKVTSTRYQYAQSFYTAAVDRYNEATMIRADAEAQLFSLAARDIANTGLLTTRSEDKKAAAEDLARIREARRELAVTSYVQGPETAAIEQFDITRVTDRRSDQVIARTAGDDARADQEVADALYAAAVADINAALAERQAVRDGVGIQIARRAQAIVDQVNAAADVAVRVQELGDARALATVVGADFPLVAMDAYWAAAHQLAFARASCRIPWWALAGIGKVESGHGTHGGSKLTLTGDSTKEIRGIALDGTNETANIGDTDGGAIDGDPTTDRAVGPMQFIPSTWKSWARDGNGDGRKDPDNIYDAALAAAYYLCDAGPMGDDAGRTRAFLSYNHSEPYAAQVLNLAHGYARIRIPPPPAPLAVPVPAPG